MAEILIKNAQTVVTMDDDRRVLSDCDIRVAEGVITEIGSSLEANGETIDAKRCVVTPGLVNTHHHLYQTLTRSVPGGAKRLAVRLAADALSHLGKFRTGGNACFRHNRTGRIGAFRLYADF